MERCTGDPAIRTVLLPRNARQLDWINTRWPAWLNTGRVVVPQKAVDGLNLLWHSDLVVSGGGTMNREAAALGVPVYSIFRGPTGAVDLALEREGRLIMLRSVDEVRQRIRYEKRSPDPSFLGRRGPTLDRIVDHIERIAAG